MRSRIIELVAGSFMILGILGLVVLAFKVSGFRLATGQYYSVTAEFDNIGGLKVRAPVTISGVSVGQVESITLNANTFRARVRLLINKNQVQLPIDTSANILTLGLLGANYIGLTPGFDAQMLHEGSEIISTRSALVLENLIGQLLFGLKSQGSGAK